MDPIASIDPEPGTIIKAFASTIVAVANPTHLVFVTVANSVTSFAINHLVATPTIMLEAIEQRLTAFVVNAS